MNLRFIPLLLLVPLGLPAGAGAAERLVLVEGFGSPACGACTTARNALEALELEFGEEQMAFVDYHTELGLSDPQMVARDAYYGNAQSPAVWFDGIVMRDASGSPVDDYRAEIRSRRAEPAELRVSADYNFAEAPGLVNVEVLVDTGRTIANPQECVVRAVILEDDVEWCCGEDGRGEWNEVARRILPDIVLTAAGSDESQTISHRVVLDPGWNPDRLRVVAFVQRDTDRSILNAARALDAGVLIPVPVVPPGRTRIILNPNVPNPSPGETEISWELDREAWVRLRIFDANGRVVRVLNDGVRPQGRSEVMWDGTDFTGLRMAAGIYVIELATPDARQSRKMALIR